MAGGRRLRTDDGTLTRGHLHRPGGLRRIARRYVRRAAPPVRLPRSQVDAQARAMLAYRGDARHIAAQQAEVAALLGNAGEARAWRHVAERLDDLAAQPIAEINNRPGKAKQVPMEG